MGDWFISPSLVIDNKKQHLSLYLGQKFPRYDNDGFGWTYPEGESEYSEKVAEKLRENCRCKRH